MHGLRYYAFDYSVWMRYFQANYEFHQTSPGFYLWKNKSAALPTGIQNSSLHERLVNVQKLHKLIQVSDFIQLLFWTLEYLNKSGKVVFHTS